MVNVDALAWIEFALLKRCPWVQAAFFTRQGGVSTGPFASLNASYSCGDSRENVDENLRRIKEIFSTDHLACLNLIHSSIYHVVTKGFPCLEGDALLTKQQDVALMVTAADCQAAVFVDPIQKAVAAVHAGWRGQAQNIYEKTILAMEKEFGSQKRDLLVGIGPSLGPKHSQFINYKSELPKSFWAFETTPLHFDLKEIARYQLESAGILPQNIEICPDCTYEDEKRFFSYRREKVSGRHAFVVKIK